MESLPVAVSWIYYGVHICLFCRALNHSLRFLSSLIFALPLELRRKEITIFHRLVSYLSFFLPGTLNGVLLYFIELVPPISDVSLVGTLTANTIFGK